MGRHTVWRVVWGQLLSAELLRVSSIDDLRVALIPNK
jgi:hypothetical protein